MQIHQTTSTQTLRFDFASDAQRQALLGRLTQGQSLQATVLNEISSGRWALRFMGHTLVAESRLALSPGQKVEARVEELGPPLVLSLSGRIRSQQASLSQGLRRMGLSVDDLNLAVVRGLMTYGLAVDRQEILALRDLLLGLDSAIDLENAKMLEEAVSRVLYLQRQGVPVNPDTLSAYLSNLSPGVLGGLLESLVGFLKTQRFNTTQEFSSLSDRILSVLPRDGNFTGEQLRQLVDILGVDLEGKLSRWIESGADGIPEPVADSIKLALLRLKMSLSGNIAGDFRNVDRQALGALSERTSDLLQMLESLQVSNLPGPNRDILHLQIPILLEGQITTADVHISYSGQGGAREIDEDNLHLSLSIELSGLGPIRLELNTAQRSATCRLFVVDETRVEFLNGVTSELAESLEKCGYFVRDIRCQVSGKEESVEAGGQPPSVGVDYRA